MSAGMKGLEERRTSVVLAIVLAAATMWTLDHVFWERALPNRLQCVVRSADGCMVWADKRRYARYIKAKAGRAALAAGEG